MPKVEREFSINGKRVVLREWFPLEEYFGLPDLAAAVSVKDARTAIPLFVVMIESWEFDGDPTDPQAYMQMDVRSEILPLINKVNEYLGEFLRDDLAGKLKN